ncbi:UDP-glucose--lipooligosaccharide glucosyltransferase [Grimontia hollisae]|uniref:Beta-1,4-galactosyltransferase n=1 Tax=Grimontia hollisae CIP 101886 TaxID=675812 RepID=D0I3Z3_GRIHO|nr:glycosyltransferase family 25 protein [Grimontia hollisae]AMG30449.1 UDP-glucose--lipooligosaccharide glucosyltransferase [Grimontia hollisae]EEY73771.1 beta-1,4-galactosyltransferase [Grimontia hollisae CIP 101886]STO41963.1 Lipooligosaccharide biosynthesis protein lex-1 [Grimontia hollisae]STQ77790.1 Lipooligosaccharide biosynthesis protein lex-1 [Grimontia hollisae]
MRIIIVSLKHSLERRKKIEKTLSALKLPFCFFDAVDGKNEHHKIFDHYNNKKRVFIKGYPLKPGELGCFASHYSLWERCVELNEPLLVLEDDIELEDDFLNVYKKMHLLAESIPYFRIGRVLDAKYKIFKQIDDCHDLVLYTKPVRSTQGYMITPEAAKKFIDAAYNWYEPVDDFMEKEWLHGVLNFGIEPPLIRHDFNIHSEIGERAKPYIPLNVRVIRELYRSYESIRKLCYSFYKMRKVNLTT